MGCFNINGGISKLPISYGDDCFLLIGLYNKSIQDSFLDSYGFLFTPIALPIYGKYDDYGRIENIIKDKNVEVIEAFFDDSIENIINLIDDKISGREYYIKKNKDTYTKYNTKLDLNKSYYDLRYVIDHKFVYDTISTMETDFYFDLKESLNFSKNIPYSLQDCINNHDFKEKYLLYDDICMMDFLNAIKKFKNDYAKKLNISPSNLLNINPNFKDGLYDFSTEIDTNIFMSIYRNDNTKILFEHFGDEYISLIRFFYAIHSLNWPLNSHVYAGQNGYDALTHLVTYYSNVVDFIKNKLNEYNN